MHAAAMENARIQALISLHVSNAVVEVQKAAQASLADLQASLQATIDEARRAGAAPVSPLKKAATDTSGPWERQTSTSSDDTSERPTTVATDTSCCADLVAEAQPPQPRPQPTPEEALATLRALLSRAEAFVKEAAEEGLATVATPTDEKHRDETLRMARTTSEAYSNNIRAQRMARNTSSKEGRFLQHR